jgi:hypothetical protein
MTAAPMCLSLNIETSSVVADKRRRIRTTIGAVERVLQVHARRCCAQPYDAANMIHRSVGLDLGLRVERFGETADNSSL